MHVYTLKNVALTLNDVKFKFKDNKKEQHHNLIKKDTAQNAETASPPPARKPPSKMQKSSCNSISNIMDIS